MSARDTLVALLRGERPRERLLPPCRLEGFGSEFYGEEAIIHAFRANPGDAVEEGIWAEAPGHIALFDRETAVLADLYGQNIARIWRLGLGAPALAEPALGVPFDTDLVQARGDVAMRAEDHPALAAAAATHVETIGRGIARDWDASEGESSYRVRPFLIRAFSSNDRAVALFAVHRLGGAAVRTAGFAMHAVHFRFDAEGVSTQHHVRDVAGEAAVALAPWRARVD